MEMEVEKKLIDKTLLIKLFGDIDDSTTENLRANLDKTLDKYDIKNIIFDLEDITFVDSSAIGLILGRYKKINKSNGRCGIIINNNKTVYKLLNISGMLSICDLFTNREEGVKSYESRK